MISPAEISVVVQGPVLVPQGNESCLAHTTAEVLKSVRANLPDSRIILSTWEGTEVTGLDYDLGIFTKDPGSNGTREKSTSANIVRQIVSSRAGLDAVRTRYALKLRSDTLLSSSSFIRLWNNYSTGGIKPRCFKKRVLVSAIFTPSPRYCPSPYWISDFFAFGQTEDVQYLWDIPHKELERMLEEDKKRSDLIAAGKPLTAPPNAEQKLILTMASKAGIRENLLSITSIDPFCLIRSERFAASHFIPVDPGDAGFDLPQRFQPFKTHHTYRRDHASAIFRSISPILARAGLVRSAAWIGLACVKGLVGRTLRHLRGAFRR